MTGQTMAVFAIRCGLVGLFFPASALDKIFNFRGAVIQAYGVFKPRAMAMATVFTGLCIEVLASIGILTGLCDRLAAVVLAGYCVATALLFKRFWQTGDFWARSDSKGRDLFWDFLKNLSLASGFLLITVGVDGAGLRPFLTYPFASTHPYAETTLHVR